MSPDSILHMLQRVLKRAELPRIRFHDLRHTFATMALQNGVDGDKTYQTTFQDVGYETMVSVTVGANRDRLQINPSNLICQGALTHF